MLDPFRKRLALPEQSYIRATPVGKNKLRLEISTVTRKTFSKTERLRCAEVLGSQDLAAGEENLRSNVLSRPSYPRTKLINKSGAHLRRGEKKPNFQKLGGWGKPKEKNWAR